MKSRLIILLVIILFSGSCVTQFVPDIPEDKSLLVIEGMITDQPEPNYIRLSMSMPIGKTYSAEPVEGATVKITDDLGNEYFLFEAKPGTYATNQYSFRGIVGRKYSLHIQTHGSQTHSYSYESTPVELKPVPPIDSVYYDKVLVSGEPGKYNSVEACQIYVDSHDDSKQCSKYRWDYEETWEFRIPYEVPNKTCWKTEKATAINIKNTTVLAEDRVSRYPLLLVTNETDRLSFRYSILVNQYSLSQDEYDYWEKLKSFTQNIGGLYDIIPASLTGNIFCVDDPAEKVLGYFSVSAKKSTRIFVNERFFGQKSFYGFCATDTVYNGAPIPGLGQSVWIIEDYSFPRRSPGFVVLTNYIQCYDCTVKGTNVKPWFWED
ncbi:MAG: DUF4249 domain-containing protein [Bacteroidales bacterium]